MQLGIVDDIAIECMHVCTCDRKKEEKKEKSNFLLSKDYDKNKRRLSNRRSCKRGGERIPRTFIPFHPLEEVRPNLKP